MRSFFPSWQLDVGNAYVVNDGRAKVEIRFPYGSWSVEEFVAMVKEATADWETVHINWSTGDHEQDPHFWITALRQPTGDDLLHIEECRKKDIAKHERDRDYHAHCIEELSS